MTIRLLELFTRLVQHADANELDIIAHHAALTHEDGLAKTRNAADHAEITKRYRDFESARDSKRKPRTACV